MQKMPIDQENAPWSSKMSNLVFLTIFSTVIVLFFQPVFPVKLSELRTTIYLWPVRISASRQMQKMPIDQENAHWSSKMPNLWFLTGLSTVIVLLCHFYTFLGDNGCRRVSLKAKSGRWLTSGIIRQIRIPQGIRWAWSHARRVNSHR